MTSTKGDIMHTKRCSVCHTLNEQACKYHSGFALCPKCFDSFEEIDRLTAQRMVDLEQRVEAMEERWSKEFRK
jgi:recombinational DNA repair protein (RecF pathway)